MRIAVKLTPRSSANRVLGVIEDGQGGWALKIAVTAPPVDGKANAALVECLARYLGLPCRDIRVVGGAAHRRKLVEIAGDPIILMPMIEEKLKPWSTPS